MLLDCPRSGGSLPGIMESAWEIRWPENLLEIQFYPLYRNEMSTCENLDPQSDEVLADLIKGQDETLAQKQKAENAFNVLYERHAPILLAFLKTRCHSNLQAVDIAQETWLRAWQKIPEYFDGTHFRGWLFQIAKNLLLDEFRKKKMTSLSAEMDAPELHDATQAFIDREEQQQLQDCMSKLDDIRQQIVRLRLSGQSHREISETLQVDYTTVQTRFHRAKQFLEDCVQSAQKEPA
ncbi:RNA polymerase sigma factor [Gimesia sp.]|uniref:RNA polymerase sigma factor n=1 Tax=Gimesia sp. TaxID=2024833 RepID=UPI003A92A59E